MIDPQLDGKVILVTGANNPHGIGAGIARAFAALGAKVFITFWRVPLAADVDASAANVPGKARYTLGNAQTADAVVQTIRDAGGRIEAWEADLSDPSVIPALFDRVEDTFGRVEVLVNNAAHWEPTTFLPTADDLVNKFSTQWLSLDIDTITAGSHERVFAVNTRAVALMMAEFARRHVAQKAVWGRIINISTDGAYCFPSEAAYGASKLALESYSRTAAQELGQYGITVNIVSPGPIQTGYITPEMEKVIEQNTPLGRVGYPADIADVVVFLASEQARWLTGQLLYVGGGHRM